MVSAPLQATSPQCYKNSLKKPKSNTVAERAFTQLKKAFTGAPISNIHTHFNHLLMRNLLQNRHCGLIWLKCHKPYLLVCWSHCVLPQCPWSHLALKFITDSPLSPATMVIIGKFPKSLCLIPLPSLPTVFITTELLFNWMFRYFCHFWGYCK